MIESIVVSTAAAMLMIGGHVCEVQDTTTRYVYTKAGLECMERWEDYFKRKEGLCSFKDGVGTCLALHIVQPDCEKEKTKLWQRTTYMCADGLLRWVDSKP